MASGATGPTLAERAQSRDPQELLALGASPSLTEDVALALLTRRDISGNVIEAIAKNVAILKNRKVNVAIASHPHAPRHVSLPLTRHLYTFDLVKIALSPAVPADVKVAVDETIIARIEQISEGERLTLAKQASDRVAGALLADSQDRVVEAALNNPQMTEAILIKALGPRDASARLVNAVCEHKKWSIRRDVRLALLRTEHLPLAHAITCTQGFPASLVREVLGKSRIQASIRNYLLALLETQA